MCNTGSTPNSFFYRGGRADATTGDYTFGSRAYAPSTGTFTEPDSYREASSAAALSLATDPLTANGFSYAGGDPVNFWDPSGHNPCASEGYDDSGQNGCTPSENQNLAAGSAPGSTGAPAYSSSTHGSSASYGTHPSSAAAPATSKPRPSTHITTEAKDTRNDDADYAAWQAEEAAQRSADRAYAVWIRHTLDANGVTRIASVGAGSDFGVSYDTLTGRCVTCSDTRKSDGHSFAWNGRTWDCSPRAHGSSCDESHTYAWNGKEVVEYDDGIKSGGFWFQVGQWVWDHKVDIGLAALTIVPGVGELSDAALAARIAEGADEALTAVRGADEALGVAGEGASAAGGNGTMTLYRAVGQSELSDVLRFGDYGLSPSGGGKYFSLSRGGAQDFMNSSFNAGRKMTLTSIEVPNGMLQRGFTFFDTGGAGASVHFADEVLPDLYQSAGLPNILEAPWVPTIDRALVP